MRISKVAWLLAAAVALALVAVVSAGSSPAQAPPQKNVVMGGSKYTGKPTGDAVKLVYVGDLAGKLGSFGPAVAKGAELMVKLANENGGIMGQPVELVTQDDQGDPANTVRLTRQEIQTKKPKMIFGGILSSALLAQAPLARQYKTPLFTTSASVSEFIGKQASLYNGMTLATSRHDSCGFAKFLATRHPQVKRVALMVVAFAYGTDFAKGFSDCMKRFSPKVQIVERKDFQIGTQNFLPFINALLAKKPDFIVGVVFGTDFVRFYQQYRGAGAKIPFSAVVTDLEAPRAIAEKGPVPRHFVYDSATRTRYTELGTSAKPWIAAYQKEYGDVPSADALQTIASFLAYKAAVEKAGTFDSTEVMRAYRCLTYYEPRGWIKVRTLNGQADVPDFYGAFYKQPGLKDLRLDPTDRLAVPAHDVWLSDAATRAQMPEDAVMSPGDCK